MELKRVIKLGLTFIITVFVLSSCKSMNMTNKIRVSFEIKNQQKFNQCENFVVKLKTVDSTYILKNENCILILPEFQENLEFIDVIFEYKDHKMEFKDVDIKMITADIDVIWNFQIDYPPFSEENNEIIDADDTEMIHYLQFNPIDDGQAIEIINPISKNNSKG